MEELRITVVRPDDGWPFNILAEAGGYTTPAGLILKEEPSGIRSTRLGLLLADLTQGWVGGGVLGAAVAARASLRRLGAGQYRPVR